MTRIVHGKADFLRLGDWNAICDRCGRKFKASEMLKTWDNLWVCRPHWEARQPQDFVRPVPDIQTPPWTRPGGGPNFVGVCNPEGITAIIDYAVVDCCIIDYISPAFDPSVY